MSEWKEYNITEVCDTISDTYRDGADKVVLINTSDVLEGKITNHEFVPNKNLAGQFKKKFQKDDILYSEIRPANRRYAYVDFDPKDYIASTKLMVLRSKPCILSEYLYYLLTNNTTIHNLHAIAVGRSGTFPQITYSELANIKFLLPSIEEQQEILSTLLAFDDKIAINRRICENLEAQAQALFKHWFIDFAPFKDGKFVDSELGMIPEGWRVGTLGELIEIKYGKDHKKLEDGTIPVYGSAGLMRKVNNYLYQGESVLIPRKGTLNNVMLVNEAFWTVDTMFYSIPKYKNILKYVFLKLRRINFTKLNVGTSIPSNSTDQLNKIVILIPSNKVLEHFETIMNDIFECKKNRDLESARLSTLRDTLLPKLMSGQIKV